MKHNKPISTVEVLQQYPFGATFIGIDELTLECINAELEKHEGFKLETLDADYVHIYNNYTIILGKLHNEIVMYVFSQKEKVSDEVIQARRRIFFDSLTPLEENND